MRKNITFEDVKVWAQHAIAERGRDFVYRGSEFAPKSTSGACVNIIEIDGKTVGSCIVGKILLNNVGVPVEFFSKKASSASLYDHNASPIAALSTSLKKEFGIKFSPEALAFLETLQWSQDISIPWGEAYDRAMDVVGFSNADRS